VSDSSDPTVTVKVTANDALFLLVNPRTVTAVTPKSASPPNVRTHTGTSRSYESGGTAVTAVTAPKIPAWLGRRIGDNHRAASLRLCPSCKAPTLVGLDADTTAFTARADVLPIDELGETIALLSGRPTYDLVTNGGRKELARREEWNIGGDRRYPVLAAHKCGVALDAHAAPVKHVKRKAISHVPQF